MNPAAILFVLSLAAPLDSPKYGVRERARLALERTEPAETWPAVALLSRSKSPDVAEAANRWVAKWPRMVYERMLATAVTDEDRLILAAIFGPIEDRPWRALDEYERSQKPWKPWAMAAWKKAKPWVNEMPGIKTHYPDGVISVFDRPPSLECGHLAGCIWHCRLIALRGLWTTPNPSDW